MRWRKGRNKGKHKKSKESETGEEENVQEKNITVFCLNKVTVLSPNILSHQVQTVEGALHHPPPALEPDGTGCSSCQSVGEQGVAPTCWDPQSVLVQRGAALLLQ